MVALFAGQAGGLPLEGNELRFYAGALLRRPDQRSLATRCLIDRLAELKVQALLIEETVHLAGLTMA